MSNIVTFGDVVLLESGKGSFSFQPGGEGRRLETKEMPDSESNYVQDLGWAAPQHRLDLSLWVPAVEATLLALFQKFDTLMAHAAATLTVPDYGPYPHCKVKERPIYNKQSKRGLPPDRAPGYKVTVGLVFEPTRSRY